MIRTTLIVVAIVLLVAVAAILAIAAMRPDTFRVQRSALINAPPERIFPLIADLRRWSAWSPWEKKDPAMQRTFGGAERGVGATYAWEGDKNVGTGRMEIIEATPPSRVAIKLDFVRPFEAHNTVTFTLTPQGDGTQVLWAMDGPVPFLFRIVHLFMNMDRMVGGDFEQGLAALKAEAEKP